MKHIAILIFIGCSISLSSQIGIRAGLNMNSYDQWSAIDPLVEDDADYLPTDIEVGINYWWRLKDYRVEFLPEVVYGFNNTTQLRSTAAGERSLSRQYFQFKVNTQFYLFDMKEDCNCPTFSKQGPPIIKGLFVYLAPGIAYHLHQAKLENETTENSSLHFMLSGGVGYDIGLTDLLTITPLVGVNLHFDDKNEVIEDWNLASANDTWNSISLGLRATFRFDYLQKPAWQR